MLKLMWWYSTRTFGGCWRLLKKRGVCGTHQLWSSVVKPSTEAAKLEHHDRSEEVGTAVVKAKDTGQDQESQLKTQRKAAGGRT